MKTIGRIIFFSTLLTLVSCYRDLSTEATMNIPEIYVSGPDKDISITFGEELVMDVRVSQKGSTSRDFTYLWEVDLVPGRPNDRIELGTDLDLVYKVSNFPSDIPYILSLTVTDKKTGYAKIASWNLFVSNTLPEGLLVAHTRDNGVTSDLDHIASKSLTYAYEDEQPKITRNVYSSMNGGEVIQGRVSALNEKLASNMATYNNHQIVLGTEKHIYALDPITYKIMAADKELFNNVDEPVYNVSSMFNYAGYVSNVLINNKMYCCTCNIDYLYSPLQVNSKRTDIFNLRNTAYARLDQGVMMTFFSEDASFYYIRGWQSFSGAMVSYVPANVSFSLEGAEAVASGCFDTNKMVFLIKDAEMKYHLCIIDVTSNEFGFLEYPLDLQDYKIDEALSFTFCDNSKIIYYSTESEIFSIVLSGDRVIVKRQNFSLGPGEKITSLIHYKQAWVGVKQYSLASYKYQLPTNFVQLVITTYNPSTSEGKVYLKPFVIGTGNIMPGDNGVYGGFGEITAIAPTLK